MKKGLNKQLILMNSRSSLFDVCCALHDLQSFVNSNISLISIDDGLLLGSIIEDLIKVKERLEHNEELF